MAIKSFLTTFKQLTVGLVKKDKTVDVSKPEITAQVSTPTPLAATVTHSTLTANINIPGHSSNTGSSGLDANVTDLTMEVKFDPAIKRPGSGRAKRITEYVNFFDSTNENLVVGEGEDYANYMSFTERMEFLYGRPVTEPLIANEQVSKSISKVLNDYLNIFEDVFREFEGEFFYGPETWSAIQEIVSFQITAFKEHQSTSLLTDLLTKDISKAIQDTVAFNENLDIGLGYDNLNTAFIQEVVNRAIAPQKSSATNLNEILTILVDAYRSHTSNVNSEESIVKELFKQVSDNLSVTDNLNAIIETLQNNLDDTALVEIINKLVEKYPQESTTFSEMAVFDAGKVASIVIDSISIAVKDFNKSVIDTTNIISSFSYNDTAVFDVEIDVRNALQIREWTHGWLEVIGGGPSEPISASEPILFPFNSSADNWESITSANVTGNWISNDGHPNLGSLEKRISGKNVNTTGNIWRRTLTFEQMGVPAGATITGIRNSSMWTRCAEYNTGTGTNQSDSCTLLPAGGSSILLAGPSANFVAVTAWAQQTGTPVSGLSYPSNTSCTIDWTCQLRTGNSTSAAISIRGDSIAFTIDYTIAGQAGSNTYEGVSVGYHYNNFQDQVSLEVGKNLLHALNTSELLAFDIGYNFVHESRISEKFNYDFSTSLNSDVFDVSSVATKDLHKVLSDNLSIFTVLDYAGGTDAENSDAAAFMETYSFDINKAVSELSITNEILSFNLQILYNHSVNSFEIVAKDAQKEEIAQANMTESVIANFFKSIVSNVQFDENFDSNLIVGSNDVELSITQYADISELLSKIINKALTDDLSANELITKNIDKTLADTPPINELISKNTDKALINTPSISELISKNIDKAPADISSVSELLNKNTNKALVNTPPITETVTANVSKTIVNTLALTEDFNSQIQGDTGTDLTRNEPVSASETGIINVQDYVEAGYFQDDYVGTNYNF
jgi:hypothetical protein